MAYENIFYDVSDRIATVTLNRPDAMNATTDELYQELQQLLGEIAADTSVGCVILTGAGKGFCAGADLKARRDHMTPIQLRARHRWILKDILEPLFRLEKPVIAAVNGAAAGAGFNIALACDFIIASEQASFIQAFAKVGLVPDLGASWLVTRAVGRARALGFSIEDCRTLLARYEDDDRASADVKAVATEHLHQIEDKIAQLQAMRDTLNELVHCCAGDNRPDCPILKDLARQ